MKRVIPGGMEDSDSDSDFVVNYERKSDKPQQTCQLRSSSVKPSSSKKHQRNQQYLTAKDKDRRLGPVDRPQEKDANQEFFKDAVRRNLGLRQSHEDTIIFPGKVDFKTPFVLHKMSSNIDRTPIWISSDDEAKALGVKLLHEAEISIDFENNNDNSYKGMTALVQLSTVDTDIILDPFPALTGVKLCLHNLFSSNSVLKILCGADNDFLNLKRDFEVYPQYSIDIQFLDKLIHNVSASHCARGLGDLCKHYLKTEIPKGEANRDWRRRPLPDDMKKYAQRDSYYCMAIFQKMKNELKNTGREDLLIAAVNDTSAQIRKLFSRRTASAQSKNEKSNPADIRSLLYDWRDTTAKLVDDKPKNVLSDCVIEKLIVQQPQTMEELMKYTERHNLILKGNVNGLLRLMIQKTNFYKNTQCRKCSVIGHSAIQCNQPIDRNIEKMLYKERPDLKTLQNRRRRQNKLKNKRLREESCRDKNFN